MTAKEPVMVTLPAGVFFMGATPDDKFADAAELPRREVGIPRSFAMGIHPVTLDEWRLFDSAAPAGDGCLPATGVSWEMAETYAGWLRAETGVAYRLPSETEWEYACRAGTQTVFHTGDTITPKQANFFYSEQGERVGAGRLLPAGSFAANGFGLFDMHGNVCEWVADAWKGEARLRVLRGGAWDHMPRLLRSARRDWLQAGARLDNVGFRLAADLP